MKKTAIILFNLGGPDKPEAVKPFLFNLFNDRAIITLPNPFRFLLAKIISGKRTPIAREIYSHIGGKSPILDETKKQATALEEKLNSSSQNEYRTFISMRYWHPFSDETVSGVLSYAPDEILLLPLYPQYSTTTTASSLHDWSKKKITIPTKTICCYPLEENFIKAHTDLIKKQLSEVKDEKFRLLFSAHGLPKKIIEKGDPYQWQVEQTAATIIKNLDDKNIDWRVCYQSKVGPLEWIGPATDDEIVRAGEENISLVIVPIAFVSEHSETLVELDMEYKKLAEESGVKKYLRVPTLSANEHFIDSLAEVCKSGIASVICSNEKRRICPRQFTKCPGGQEIEIKLENPKAQKMKEAIA